MNTESFDVVVLGSGASGSSAAAAAARAGARVALLEKQDVLGGSAAMSAGMFWTAPDFEALRRRIPLGRPDLGRALVDDYPVALQEIRATGVRVADRPQHDIMTFGVGHSLDIHALLDANRRLVEQSGGVVRTAVRVVELCRSDETVTGIVAEVAGQRVGIRAASVVLATGGFQGDPQLVARYLGWNADRMPLRSNPGSVGDGLRFARSAGAGGTKAMSTFYGHLIPWPLDQWGPEAYLPYSQFYSGETVMVNLRGDRFCDETQGDELLNQLVLREPEGRAVLIFDDHVRREVAVSEPFPGLGSLDRVQIAIDAGGQHASAPTLAALAQAMGNWGVDPASVLSSLHGYQAAVANGAVVAQGVPVSPRARPMGAGPYHAVMVQPSLTFTFGGIPITTSGEVCDPDGRVIPGLFAAGADIGGLSNFGYAGGLAPAYISGRWAGRAAAARARALDEG